MRRRPFISMGLAAAAAAGCASVFLTAVDSDLADAVAALSLMFAAPAAVVAVAVGPRFSSAERMALGLATAISVTALIVVGMDAAGIALDTKELAIALGSAVIVGCLLALVQPGMPRRGRGLARPRLAHLAGSAAIVLFLGAAGLLTADTVDERESESTFTQVWAVPAPGDAGTAVIGVRNHEGSPQRYTARVSIDGEGDKTRSIVLADGEAWTERRSIGTRGEVLRVEVTRGGGAAQSTRLVLDEAG